MRSQAMQGVFSMVTVFYADFRYYLTPAEFLQESVKRRELVDRHGFVDVPLWCMEWHCSPFWHAFADPAAHGK